MRDLRAHSYEAIGSHSIDSFMRHNCSISYSPGLYTQYSLIFQVVHHMVITLDYNYTYST